MKPVFFGQPARLLLTLLFPFFFGSAMHAAIINSKQSGSWTSASTWEGGVVPTNFQDVVIKVGHTVTRTNAFVCQSHLYVYGTLVYQGNVAREFYAGFPIEIDGLLLLQGGTLFADGLVYGDGTFRQTAGNTTFGRAYVIENTDIQGGSVYFKNINNADLHLDNLTLKNATLDANSITDIEIKVSMNWNNNGKLLSGAHLKIEDGAVLTFDGGNNKHYSDGTLKNYGTMYCASGGIDHINGIGHIYNYGLWEFNVQANASHYLTSQLVSNRGGTILKKGPGGLIFSSSSGYSDEMDPVFQVAQGSASLTTNSVGHELNGLWQVDAGASLLLSAPNTDLSVPAAMSKFINNGNVYGRLKFLGGALTTISGSGKYDRMEIAKAGDVVTLAGSPEITTAFTLTSGRIVLNQYDLRLGTATVSYTSDYDSYIETNGTGSCMRLCPVGGFTFFPVGQDGFAPLLFQMTPGSVPDLVKVRVTDSFYGEYNGNTPACSDQVSVGVVGRNWFVSEQTSGGSNATLAAYWLPSAERVDFDRTNCTLGRYINGDWQSKLIVSALELPPLYAAYDEEITSFGLFGVFDAGHDSDVNFIAPAPTANAPICEWNDLQLYANTSPNAEIQWTGPNGFQSNEHDPFVSGIQLSQGGVYTAVASQYSCPEKQASVNVQVNAEPTPIILGSDHIQPGESVALVAYGGIFYLWSTGETTQSITVFPIQTTDYQVVVTNPSGCTAIALHTIQVSGASAAQEAEGIFMQMKIAPNPASDATMLSFEAATTGSAELNITDMRGVQLFRQKVDIRSGLNQLNISLANFPAGTCQMTLIRESEVKTIQLVKMMGE